MMHYYPLGILVVSWLFYFWDNYLSYRQYKTYKTVNKLPKELDKHIDYKTFEKARQYSVDKAHFGFISGFYSEIQSSTILCCALLPYFWKLSENVMTSTFIGASLTNSDTIEWEILQSIIFSVITSLASTIVNLPTSIYSTFVIEQRHGFNRQTALFYIWDNIKAFLVSTMITSPVLAAIIYIVRKGGPYFFLYLWIFVFVVMCLLTFFSGEIAAIFDKFTALPEGDLRNKIEKLAQSLNYPLSKIYVVEGSKRSAHSNAYQTGFLKKKRIVIYDTLIEGYYKGKENENKDDSDGKKHKKGCTTPEILAVLCHELGHWACSHIWKNLLLTETNLLFIFLIFSRLYTDPEFYAAFGFTQEMPVIIGLALVMMLLTPYNAIVGFIMTLLSRKFEYEADEFAARLGHADKLVSALVKLHKDNLGFPVHDYLYSMFNHSHPTLLQRMGALRKFK